MSLCIYHGNENWILKGIALDLQSGFVKACSDFRVERAETNGDFSDVNQSPLKYHLFLSVTQLNLFVRSHENKLPPYTLLLFTHFDASQFNSELLNQLHSIIFMSSSQMSVAVANGLDPSICHVIPLGVDQSLHKVLDQSKIHKIQRIHPKLSVVQGRSALGFSLRYWDKPSYTSRKRYDLVVKIAELFAVQFNIPVILVGPGWSASPLLPSHENIIPLRIKYSEYPLVYNMMRVFASLSLHEGGPVPLLESLSCGVTPVVTQTGFAFDVLSASFPKSIIPVDASYQQIVHSLLSAYNNPFDHQSLRACASGFTFHAAAFRILHLLSA